MQKQLSIKSKLRDNKIKAMNLAAFITIQIVLNIANLTQSNNSDEKYIVLMGLLLGLGDALMLISFVVMINKPVLSVLMLLSSQIISFIHESITDKDLIKTLENMSISLTVIFIAIIVQFIIANKSNKKTESWKEQKITKKIKANILYDRNLVKIPIWAKIIIYSLLVTVIMTYANSKILTSMYSNVVLRVILAVSLIVPIFLIISMLTTSYLAYEMLLFKTVFNGLIVVQLIIGKEASVIQVIQLLLEILFTIFCYLLILTENDKIAKKNRVKKEK